jgi:hypothetical protein
MKRRLQAHVVTSAPGRRQRLDLRAEHRAAAHVLQRFSQGLSQYETSPQRAFNPFCQLNLYEICSSITTRFGLPQSSQRPQR